MYLIAFIIGYISGALLVIGAGVFALSFKMRVESEYQRTGKKMLTQIGEIMGIRKRGAIIMPPSEIDEARQSIIDKNREAGIDTPISELTEDND